MSLFYVLLLVAIYLIGGMIAWQKIKNWKNPLFEKVYFSILWPFTLLFYGIHKLNNR